MAATVQGDSSKGTGDDSNSAGWQQNRYGGTTTTVRGDNSKGMLGRQQNCGVTTATVWSSDQSPVFMVSWCKPFAKFDILQSINLKNNTLCSIWYLDLPIWSFNKRNYITCENVWCRRCCLIRWIMWLLFDHTGSHVTLAGLRSLVSATSEPSRDAEHCREHAHCH